MSSGDPPSARPWAMLTVGIAFASSALTVVSILGVQRFQRRRLRHDLEDDVRKAVRRHDDETEDKVNRGTKEAAIDKSSRRRERTRMDSERSETSMPRYLAALAAQQSSSASSANPRASFGGGNGNDRPNLSSTPSDANLPYSSRPSTPSGGPRKTMQASRKAFEYDESLIREQLSRNYSFLGEEPMAALRNSFVIVVGAGGVGSWCALMLLRSGVGRLRLIDFDQVSLSSLNRHACATLADVGRPKVQVCKEHFADVAPWCDVDARVEIFRGGEAARLLAPATADPSRRLEQQSPTYVIDCIDNLDTKVDLLAFCYHNKIPCFSSMGAGAKSDPSQIQVADLNTTAEDPLARRVRRGLRAKGVWGGGVMAKKSNKKPDQKVGARQDKGSSAQNGAEEKRKKDQQEALEKLEAKSSQTQPTTTNSFTHARKLEHSGRGADEGSNARGSKRISLTNTPSISRRASSTSSTGSVYFSPSSTPAEESTLENVDGDLQSGGFRLPDAADFEKKDTVSKQDADRNDFVDSPEEVKDHGKRPPLATLRSTSTASSSGAPSRRSSSLAELAAEEMKSGDRRSVSGQQLPTHEEGNEEEESVDDGTTETGDETVEAHTVDDDEQAGETPYTIMCVYTNEKSDTRLLPLDEEELQKGAVDELAALEDFRVRILPVLGPLPAMFGLAAATYVICTISGRKLEPLPFKGRRKTAERMFMEVEQAERRYPSPGSKLSAADMAIGPRRVPWTVDDVAYVFEEVYRCRSVVPPHETLTIGKLLRWDSTLPLSYSNVALFSRGEGMKHEEQVLKLGRSPVEVWGEEATRMFKKRMAEERRMNALR